MTLLEFITDLQSQGFTDKEVFDKAQEFKKNKATEEVVEETEVAEETVEEVEDVEKVEEVEEVEEGNSNDSTQADADVDQTVVASEETETTESISEDGSLESQEKKEEINVPAAVVEDFDSIYGEKTMAISFGDLRRTGLELPDIVKSTAGSGRTRIKVSDFLNSPEQTKRRQDFFNLQKNLKPDSEKTKDIAVENYFAVSQIEKPSSGGISKKGFGDNYRDEYVKLSKTEAQALGITKDMKGRLVGQDGQPSNARYNYDDYLKGKLGDRYDEYIKYQENPDGFKFPPEVIIDSEKREIEKQFQNLLRAENDPLFQESLKPFIEAQLKNETIKLEAAKKYQAAEKKLIEDKAKAFNSKNKELEAQSKPFIEEINNSVEDIKKQFGDNIFEDGLTQAQIQNPFILKKFDTYLEKVKAAQTAYEEQEFEAQYELLAQDQNGLEILVDNFNSGLKDSFDGTDLEKAEMMAKSLNMDYSLTASLGASIEDFFIGGTKNVASMIGQGFLKLAKGMTTPENAPKLDKMIEKMQQNITNYNVRIAAKREATIPPPLKADDIQGIGGTFRYIGEALSENGPSILTTFLPLGAAFAGGLRIAGATARGVGMKAALKAQKRYAMFAMRSSQAIFFTGESGGKYGEIQVAEDKAIKALPEMQQRYNNMVVGENGVTQDDKNQLANEIADNKRMSSYSFAQKAFTSFGYGGTAALAETFGSLKFVTGGANLAKNYGKVVAKKAAYESMGKYRIQLAKTYIKGMSPLVTKAAPTEVMEEGLTQIGHNSFDIIALGEDKSMFEGLDKDFLLKTAITSFAIGGPTTMQGTVNLLKNEVRTKQEVDANKLKVNELLNIEARKQPGKPLSKLDQQRKTELITDLAFDDALTTQKMAHLSVDQIEEVGEINRQLRSYKAQMRGLGTTGDVASADSKQAQKLIQDKVAALDAKKQNILGAKNKTMAEKALELKTRFGSQSAIDVQKYLGLNDFANDAAMVLSAKGKKYIKIENVNGGYPTLSDIKSQLKEGGFSDSKIGSLAPRLAVDETGTGKPTNGLEINGDIIVNQAAIDARIQNSVDSSDAAYAAVAPLEELFHADLRDKKMVDKNGELGLETTAAINEAVEQIENAKELGNISDKDYNALKERFDLYKSKDGSYDMEEVMAQINNAMILGAINKSDFTNMNSTKAMLNGMVKNVLGENSWMLNVKTGSDMFNMLDRFQDRVADKDAAQGLGDDDELDQTQVKESRGAGVTADQTLINKTTLEQLKDPNISKENKERLTKIVVENNSGLFLGKKNDPNSNKYGVNFDANFKGFKNRDGNVITRQEVLNEISTKLPNIINAYDIKGEGNFATYAGASLKFKIPEIKEAIIGAKDIAKRKQTSIDDSTLQIADESSQDFDTKETQKDTSRKKVYPSQMESVSKTIKPETIASIKEDAKREILLNASKGPEAIIKGIKSEAKNIARKLAKDTGTFKKGWPNFVNDIVNEGLTKVIPAAALKRRFGSVLGIEQTGVTPTKRVNPKTGKVTNFNKPVYRIPKANDQKLIDYFTGQEKRKTSLLEVLGQDLVVEQMEELMADQDFMSKLDTATDGKAVEIMETLNNDLDARKLEDTSIDTVKASRGKEFKALTQEEFKKQQISIAQTADINEVAKILGYPNVTATKENKEKRRKEILNLIKKGKIGSVAFELTRLEFNARKYKYVNGEKVFEIKSGEYVKESDPKYKKAEKEGGFVADGNSLYYSKKDPAYITAIEAAKKNDTISFNKKLLELNSTRPKIGKVIVPLDGNLDAAWVKRNSVKMKKNQEALQLWIQAMNEAANNGASVETIGLMIGYAYQASTGIIKIGAPFKYTQDLKSFKVGNKAQGRSKKLFREEHNPPASTIGGSIWGAIKSDNIKGVMSDIKSNFSQAIISKFDDSKIDDAGLAGKLSKGKDISDDPALRYAESGIDLETLKNLETKETMAFEQNVASDIKNNPNIIEAQNDLVAEQNRDDNPISAKESKGRIIAYGPVAIKESKAGRINVKNTGNKVSNEQSIAKQIETLGNYDKALSLGRNLNTPAKGISVFDFDDTLAKTKEKVLYTKLDGSKGSLTAQQFAEQATDLESNGVTFDFSEFDNVVNAKKGPLADLALKRQDKFGSKDIFVLTARPQQSAQGIKMFLDGIGLNLPFKNITGLENGSPQAKAGWVVSKAAEGYNDFYFADDAIQNVKAVAEILDQIDVKSKVQQAKASKGKTFSTVMNNILEDSTGIKSEAEFSKARAQTVGASKSKFTFFTTPSAEDFLGLVYKFIGKGKVGDAQLKFFKDNVFDPYNRAEQAVTRAKITAANDFKALKNSLKTLPKSLSKQTGIGGFTFGQAARVAVWTRQGMEVPGLSKRDAKELNDFVKNKPELDVFVDELIKIQKGKPYPKPGQTWLAGNITSDIVNEINKVNRKEYMQEFNENVDIIFSDKVMNKLEAAYGPKYVEALRDTLRRMKSGSNRPVGNSRIVDGLLNWLNNSVGAIMFLNTRSAVLQTRSAVNFINFGNNNLLAAGKAFANQKQYWKDFMTLFNSPYLVERRDGLKINVSESEIADAVSESSNKPKAFLNLLLSKGFVLTRFADSFAIAAGGSTFYRNQVAAYVKGGMDQKAAEKQAFDDFYAIAEESQQSSNPSKISQQQASGAGRVILAFANTPMQYARIIKRASQDLINGRGDWKTNVSKIVYYGAMQNLIFNALSSALFALAFDEEDEEKEDKTGRIANGMADSLLRGLGIRGAAVAAIKDALITVYEEESKEKGAPELRKAIADLFGFSPPLDSKVRKLTSGLNTLSWEREKMKQEGFNLNNPAYLAFAQVLAGLTNVPLDRAIQKINNLRAVTSDSSAKWQKVALLMGWSAWDLGLPYYGVEDKEVQTPQTILRDKVLKMKKETSTKQQKETLLELGLTKQQIKALKYEEARVKKIIELQEKNKK